MDSSEELSHAENPLSNREAHIAENRRQGFVAFYRSILDDDFYSEPRQWSRFEAWIDFIFQARFADSTVCIEGNIIRVPRGSFITSYRNLCKKYRWSATKLKKFIDVLVADNRIAHKPERHYSHIYVINYVAYQAVLRDERAPNERGASAERAPNERGASEKNQDNKETKKQRNHKEKTEHALGVFLTADEHIKFINDHGSAFVERCCEKLSAWIEQSPTPTRKRNGKNAAATFRVWVLNAVAEEESRASRLQHSPKPQQATGDPYIAPHTARNIALYREMFPEENS